MVKVSLSKRWFMVTMIPNDRQAEMMAVTGTFIMLATSITVTYSVTFNTLSSAERSCSSFITWSLRSARLSRRILEPLDLRPPVSFSSVSRICFWICSSVIAGLGPAGCLSRRPGPWR